MMAKKLDFKDYMIVDLRPGADGQEKYNAYKRKKQQGAGTNAEYSSVHAPIKQTDEALSIQGRRKKAIQFKKLKSKIKMGRERAKRRVASPEKLKQRAHKQARMAVFKLLSKKVSKDDMSFARRGEIETRLNKPVMQNRIDRLAKKLLPIVRKAELAKKRGGANATTGSDDK